MKNMYSNISGTRSNYYKGSCCEWCDDYAQGRAVGNTPPAGSINGVPCSDEMCGNPQFCPGSRPLTPGSSVGRPTQMYSNFVDADANSSGDSDFLYHPGLFGWCWKGKKKCEQERYDKAVSKFDSDYPLDANQSCDDLDDTITDIDNRITSTLNSGAKDRVINRNVRALENKRLDFKTAYEDNECSQQRLDEQTADFDAKVQEMFALANQRSLQRQTEDKTLRTVAIGVGALVIGAVVVMGMRK